jgi:hypothetical protein
MERLYSLISSIIFRNSSRFVLRLRLAYLRPRKPGLDVGYSAAWNLRIYPLTEAEQHEAEQILRLSVESNYDMKGPEVMDVCDGMLNADMIAHMRGQLAARHRYEALIRMRNRMAN